MTDYFTLLDQPRQPWLDLEQLKETFHAKTLRAHPDAQAQSETSSETAFAELNEAYQVLRDPKRRLHHLLTFERNLSSPQNEAVPPEIEALFPVVADVTQELEALLQKLDRASSTLSRSLLKTDLLAAAERLHGVLERLSAMLEKAEARLREVSQSYEGNGTEFDPELRALYLQFSYLTKWIADLREQQSRLANPMP